MNQHVTLQTAEPRTLADVRLAVEIAPGLSPIRRRDLLSSLSTAERWLNRPLGDIPTEMVFLRQALGDLHHVQLGVTRKRRDNVLSGLKAAFALAAPPERKTRHRAERTPEWQQRLASLPDEWNRHRLAGLATFCSAEGISSDDVDDTVLERYRVHLSATNLRKDPDAVCKLTIYTWNRSIDDGIVPAAQRLTVPRSDKHWTIPLAEFPESFQEDLDAWLDCLAHVDRFSSKGPTRALRSISIENIRVAIRRAASALVMMGEPRETITSLACLTDPAQFKSILQFFINRNDGEVPTSLYGLASKIVAIARHHVGLIGEPLEELMLYSSRVKISRSGMTEKNKARLGQFEDPKNVARLLRLPLEIEERVKAKPAPSSWDALDMMIAVAVEILLACPMRVSNLASLDLQRHFTWRGQGNPRRATLTIPGAETKNDVAIECDLPRETSRLIWSYVTSYRHLVSAAPGDWLFPNRSGTGQRRPGALSNHIFRTIHRETGLTVNAHLFRHLAGMLYLMRRPGHYETVRQILGHRSVNTTTAFYTGLESKWAIRHYDETILADRGWVLDFEEK